MLNNIPEDLKSFDQWIVWRFEHVAGRSKPTKIPYSPKYGSKASVTAPDHWGSFADACAAMNSGLYSGLGFVLTREDPFGFIDLDNAWQLNEAGNHIHADPQYVHNQQVAIYNAFNSYAEFSPSKEGLHILVKSPPLPTGRKRASVEVYTQERYMTVTGDVKRAEPIREYGDMLHVLYNDLGGPAAIENVGVNEPQTEDDVKIIQRGHDASNGEKFKALWEGRYADVNYPSQSEADFALVDMIAFYTQNRLQIERIFHTSALGQRDKAKRADYMNYMINKAFDRMLPPVDTDGLLSKLKEVQEAAFNVNNVATANPGGGEGSPPPKPAASLEPGGTDLPAVQGLNQTAPEVNPHEIPFPPGIVGRVAQFIYDQAPRPVHSIALAGAVGFIAGIVGRAYNVSATGLNQYVLLIAPTGTGKEAINLGTSKLVGAITGNVMSGDGAMPKFADFVGPGEIRSDAALLKWCARTSCFYSLIGEFGLRLGQMSAPNASPTEKGLKKVLLDLYNKSGYGNTLGAMAYSDKDKTTDAIAAPAFTLIGETTPGRFYETLDESMIADGLLPRFFTIEYTGKRPKRSTKHESVTVPDDLRDELRTLVAQCLHLMEPNSKPISVVYKTDAQKMLDDFDVYCDAKINAGNQGGSSVVADMWNRGHVKALKLAALVAVGIYPDAPVIDANCAKWAIDCVKRDANTVIGRFERGEIGAGAFGHNEGKQHKDVLNFLRRYYGMSAQEASKKYKVAPAIFEAGIVPYSALSKATLQLASFRNGKVTPSLALKNIVQAMTDADELREIPRSQMNTTFNTTARAFAVSNPASLFSE